MKKFLDVVLIACFISVWVFILLILGVFIYVGSVPDELIIGFFSIFGGEGLLCAAITIVKQLVNKKHSEDTGECEEEYYGME